jgi:hypothetical protein
MNAFLEKLQSLDPPMLRAFAKDGMTVVSREDLPADMRDRVRKTLEDRLDAPAAITFECAPAMAWGVELRGSGQRIGWTPDAYLDSLEDKLRAALDKAAAQNYQVVV